MDIEIRRGLAEARALAGEHRNMLAAYVLLGIVVPFLLLSSEPIFSLRTVMAILSDPWSYRVGGSITGPLYLLGIVAVIVAGAMLAAWNGILAEMREGYISEMRAIFRKSCTGWWRALPICSPTSPSPSPSD